MYISEKIHFAAEFQSFVDLLQDGFLVFCKVDNTIRRHHIKRFFFEVFSYVLYIVMDEDYVWFAVAKRGRLLINIFFGNGYLVFGHIYTIYESFLASEF